MANPDLPSAAVAYLRTDATLVSLLGDSGSTPKYFAEKAENSPALPWVTYHEPDESRQPGGRDGSGVMNYYGRGHLVFRVTGLSRRQARSISDRIAVVLEDAPLGFADGVLLEITFVDAKWVPVVDPSVGSVTAYARAVEFVYVVQRTF
jgi:hypothetical protein